MGNKYNMSTIQHTQPSIGIIGAGLAGILVAQACIDEGLELAWIVDGDDSLRGSGSPTALFHPFPGRSLKLHPLLSEAVASAQRVFIRWKQRYPTWIREASMVRSFAGLGGSRVKESFERTYIRDKTTIPSWLQMNILDEKEMAASGFLCDHSAGGMVYTPAMSIDLSEVIQAEQKRLSVHHIKTPIQKMTYSQRWALGNKNDSKFLEADIIVLCLGRGMNQWFPNLRLGEYGGELILCDLLPDFHEIYSANGRHIGRHHSGRYVFGASRWLPEQKPLLLEVQKELEEDVTKIFPNAHRKTKDTSIWRGYRAVYHRDRLPISGKIPNVSHMYTCCALGSKGLLWGALSAQYCVEQIRMQLGCNSKKIKKLDDLQSKKDLYSTYLSIDRVSKERWLYDETCIVDFNTTSHQP